MKIMHHRCKLRLKNIYIKALIERVKTYANVNFHHFGKIVSY